MLLRSIAPFFAAIAFAACGGPDAPQFADGESALSPGREVALRSAVAGVLPGGYGRFSYQSSLTGVARVLDLAYQKRVFVAYKALKVNDGTVLQNWTTIEAQWASGQYWTFATPPVTLECPHYCYLAEYEFALGYTVNGRTYWDNNGGQNYRLQPNFSMVPMATRPAVMGELNVRYAMSDWTASDNTWRGTIALKSRSGTKTVRLWYSTDNWRTTQQADASFSNVASNGFEFWQFGVPMPTSATSVKFAVRYDVSGRTYWDNNFRRDYTVRKQ